MPAKKKQKTSGSSQKPRGSVRGYPISKKALEEINDVAQEYEEPGESPLPQEEMDECVSETMRLVLAQNEKKPLCPVPYTAITARLKQLQQRKSGIAKAVIAHAQKKFLNFGYELVEIKAGTVTSYVLRSILPGEFLKELVCNDADTAFAGLKLHLSLYLHVKGDKATEGEGAGELRKYLALLGINLRPLKEQSKVTGGEVGDVFGTPNPIQALIDQKFLKCGTQTNADGSVEEVLMLGEATLGDANEYSKDEIEGELRDLVAN